MTSLKSCRQQVPLKWLHCTVVTQSSQCLCCHCVGSSGYQVNSGEVCLCCHCVGSGYQVNSEACLCWVWVCVCSYNVHTYVVCVGKHLNDVYGWNSHCTPFQTTCLCQIHACIAIIIHKRDHGRKCLGWFRQCSAFCRGSLLLDTCCDWCLHTTAMYLVTRMALCPALRPERKSSWTSRPSP